MGAVKLMDQPSSGSGRSLAGFYVAVGVASALLLLGAWLWTPLRIWYWERELRGFLGPNLGSPPTEFLGGPRLTIGHHPGGGRTEALGRLLEIGPAAGPALRRIMETSTPSCRIGLLTALAWSKETWPLHILVEIAGSGGDAEAAQAIETAGKLSGRTFFPNGPMHVRFGRDGVDRQISPEELRQARQEFAAWWEREGRDRCGGSQR